VTTAKDFVRLPQARRGGIGVLDVVIAWREPDRLNALLDRALSPIPARG